MAFRFPLATVLRVRTIQEEREERTLAQITAEIVKTVRQNTDLEAAIARVSDVRHAQVAKQWTGAGVHGHYGELASLRQAQTDLQTYLAKLQDLKEKQLRAYSAARQNREMLSELDDAKRAAYEVETARREQKNLDDLFGSRRSRR